jgi:hypothetical protein
MESPAENLTEFLYLKGKTQFQCVKENGFKGNISPKQRKCKMNTENLARCKAEGQRLQ